MTNQQVIAREKEIICKEGRRKLGEIWQSRWHGEQTERSTYHLIPELATWLDRKHGKVGFYLAQALSGHDCFNGYLKRFKKRDDDSFRYCSSPVNDFEYTLFICARWGVARVTVRRIVGTELTPDTTVTRWFREKSLCSPSWRDGFLIF